MLRKIFSFILYALLLGCSYLSPTYSFCQFTKLHDFEYHTSGSTPLGSLYFDGNFFYGTTFYGGVFGTGTIFKVKPDGTGFVTLYDFVNPFGSNPRCALISDGIFLYGMASTSGIYGDGNIFKIRKDGTGFVTLYDFEVTTSGWRPQGSLIFDGTFLYGMTIAGPSLGTIFKIKTDGSGYLKLLDFTGASNGAGPLGSLISDGTFLYGMTVGGGVNDDGTIFKIKTDGTEYSKLLDFGDASTGSKPQGSLLADGNFLYGMTTYGGPNFGGTIFKIKTDGTAYERLFIFTGDNPVSDLISDGTFLYGMTEGGVNPSNGIIFKIKFDGTAYETLFNFENSTGRAPMGYLTLDGNSLYGLAAQGGANDEGTMFKFDLNSTPFIPNLSTINIPNLITPDGDGKNDKLIIENIKGQLNLEIFTRWGERIFKSENYKNNWGDSTLSEGIYYYHVKQENGKDWKGWIQVLK
jgi:gliding motility-associated-like protein